MMNQTQLKYTRQRAEAIFNIKNKQLIDKYTTPAVYFTNEEKVEAIRNGNFVVLEPESKYDLNRLSDFIKFPEESNAIVDSVSLIKGQTALKSTYQNLLDELILGDNEEALKLLKEFESGE